MAATLIFASLPFALIASALADLTPTAPGPGQTFNAGSNCTIEWDVDQSGTWKNVTIGAHLCYFLLKATRLISSFKDLMSGSNNNMSWVANVAWGLDGTNSTLTSFNWTCPEVDPYAPIYFYQVCSESLYHGFDRGLTGHSLRTTGRWKTLSGPPGLRYCTVLSMT